MSKSSTLRNNIWLPLPSSSTLAGQDGPGTGRAKWPGSGSKSSPDQGLCRVSALAVVARKPYHSRFARGCGFSLGRRSRRSGRPVTRVCVGRFLFSHRLRHGPGGREIALPWAQRRGFEKRAESGKVCFLFRRSHSWRNSITASSTMHLPCWHKRRRKHPIRFRC